MSRKGSLLPWLLAAVAYAIAFMQRVALQTFIDKLSHEFHSNAEGAGLLVSGYFFAYVALQIPAGILVDTFGVRRVIIASLAISTAGTFAFAVAPSLPLAFVARMVIASGDALIFTATIKMVAQQFSARKFGLMSGLSQVSGYVGGMLATTPLAILISLVGWRLSFGMLACILASNLCACYLVLPRETANPAIPGRESWGNVRRKLNASVSRMLDALRTREAWGCALIFASHFVAVTSLTAAWGIPMLMQAYGLDRTAASQPMLIFMAMNIAGSLYFGYLSDKIRNLPRALALSCIIRSALVLALTPYIGSMLGMTSTIILFGAMGLIAGSVVPLILKYLSRVYEPEYVATGVAINSTLAGIICGLLQPVIGFALEVTWSGLTNSDGKVYSISGYNVLMVLLAVFSLLGVVGPLMLRAGPANPRRTINRRP
jgi:MFS family permease